MSRRTQRLSSNADSLLDIKRRQRFCFCGFPGGAVYDEQGDFVTYLCETHKAENGYCAICGETLTAAEKQNAIPICNKHLNQEMPF